MIRNTGLKRKHFQSDLSQECIIPTTLKSIEGELNDNSNIDDLISTYISHIRCGNNSDLTRQALHLERLKEKQIAAADKLRKLQIKNINQLFEFELENVQALYERSFKELQDDLIHALTNERSRLINVQQKLRSNPDTQIHNLETRSLRSSLLENELESKNKIPKVKRKKINSWSEDIISSGIQESLSDESVRDDLKQIVLDMEQQAHHYFVAHQSEKCSIEVSVNDDCSCFILEGISFHVGEEVSIFSTLSQENLNGIVTSINIRELILRTEEGNRFSVQFSMLASGRVIVSKESNILERLRHIQSSENDP